MIPCSSFFFLSSSFFFRFSSCFSLSFLLLSLTSFPNHVVVFILLWSLSTVCTGSRLLSKGLRDRQSKRKIPRVARFLWLHKRERNNSTKFPAKILVLTDFVLLLRTQRTGLRYAYVIAKENPVSLARKAQLYFY